MKYEYTKTIICIDEIETWYFPLNVYLYSFIKHSKNSLKSLNNYANVCFLLNLLHNLLKTSTCPTFLKTFVDFVVKSFCQLFL